MNKKLLLVIIVLSILFIPYSAYEYYTLPHINTVVPSEKA
jgi:hypothetical protein